MDPNILEITDLHVTETISHGEDFSLPVAALHMESFLERELNVGFSGGELKRAEILKLYAQNPDLLLIDEPESGVDIENISVISNAIKQIISRVVSAGGNVLTRGEIVGEASGGIGSMACNRGACLPDGLGNRRGKGKIADHRGFFGSPYPLPPRLSAAADQYDRQRDKTV